MNALLMTYKLFARVARHKSFSIAAKEVGLAQSSVSRTIAALESELGVRLFLRTTRAVELTETGQMYLQRIEPLIAQLEEANQAVKGNGELSGTLRIGLTSGMALREVLPMLSAFVDRHPTLNVNLILDDARQDLIKEGVDVAIRCGPLADSTATTRVIGTTRRVLVASPDYLKRNGTPSTPHDLARHAIIAGPPGATSGIWNFARDAQQLSVRIEPKFAVNINDVAMGAAVQGLGITMTSCWACKREVADGSLVRILDDWTLAAVKMYAVFPAGLASKPAARAFVEYFMKQGVLGQ
ncbi:LysR family transcriptional regulator [Pseudomonas sp. NPDC090202]|uniref:LysR family transcriptional regulator n=1 Tax=unclassified Pseudomonas TaxID=196821 RepID=UPI00381C775D